MEVQLVSDLKDSGDLGIRFKTDIKSGDSIYTDLNGHTIQQHRFKKKLLTQGNFFPMPSTAFIQDSSTRLSLLGSEPHGVASLAEGLSVPQYMSRVPSSGSRIFVLFLFSASLILHHN